MSNNYDEYEYDDSNISKKRKSYDFLEKIGVILLIWWSVVRNNSNHEKDSHDKFLRLKRKLESSYD